MIQAFQVTGRAFALWWREFILLAICNLAWLALQLLIVTGPPATAAMYGIARRIANDDYVEPSHIWQTLRQMFLPAWKWGAANLLMALVVVGNFWAYQDAVGLPWTILRLAWGMIALGWFAANLFYWPFWLTQGDRSLRTTLRNGYLFLAKRPGFALSLVLICAGLSAVSILLTLPLAIGLMAWLALIGVLAVDEELKRGKV